MESQDFCSTSGIWDQKEKKGDGWKYYRGKFYAYSIMYKCWYLEYVMEKAMAPHSSTPAWKISWTKEPDALQSMGLLRVGHNWATSLSLFTFMYWRRKWQPTPVFLPGESQGQQSLVGCIVQSMGSHRVEHDWSDLAAATAAAAWYRDCAESTDCFG